MKRIRAALIVMLMALMTTPLAMAATPDNVVTEADVKRQVENSAPTDDWVLYTRAGTPPTAGAFVDGPGTPPEGTGSLQLTTATSGEKVFLFNYDHIGISISGVGPISYSTYRSAGSGNQLAALNLQVDYNGTAAGGFTTLVFEPVYNLSQQAVTNNTWQSWIATGSGRWWSTQPINGQCSGATAACFRTWSQIVVNNPDGVITGGVGINQGSGNAGLINNVDAFQFKGITYDFELTLPDTDFDGVPDRTDNCPNLSNPGQANNDGDSQGDACDVDDDNDGVDDEQDAFPFDANETIDTDNDGVGNNADNCDTVANTNQANNDGDSQGDACDVDDDNDGVDDEQDAFPLDPTESVDTDGDGTGNNADTDDDGDGVSDDEDGSPLIAGPVTKDECKNGGWALFTNPKFKNQGQCVAYVNARP